MDKLNLSDRQTWNLANAQRIASEFHCEYNEEFIKTFTQMIEIAQAAETCKWLEPIAQGMFTKLNLPSQKTVSSEPAPSQDKSKRPLSQLQQLPALMRASLPNVGIIFRRIVSTASKINKTTNH